MMRTQKNPKQAVKLENTHDSLPLNEDSGTYSGILGKRLHNEISAH